MTELLALTVLMAFATAGFLFCANKWGWRTAYQLYRSKWMPPGDCYFCMSAWLAAPVFLMYGVIMYGGTWWGLIMIPLLVAADLALAAMSAFVCRMIIEPQPE